jgi:hypothetical protein
LIRYIAFKAQANEFALPMPFRSHLQGQIMPGQTLYMHGNINDGAQRYFLCEPYSIIQNFSFEVNLLSGTSTIDQHIGNAVLHISVRFDEGKIVLNTMNVIDLYILIKSSNKYYLYKIYIYRMVNGAKKSVILTHGRLVNLLTYE